MTSVNVITYFIIPTGSNIIKAGGLPNRDDKQQEKGAELFSKLYFFILFINERIYSTVNIQKNFFKIPPDMICCNPSLKGAPYCANKACDK